MSGLVLHFSTYISQCPFITVELVLDQHFPRTCIDLDFRSLGRAASSAPEPLMHHQPQSGSKTRWCSKIPLPVPIHLESLSSATITWSFSAQMCAPHGVFSCLPIASPIPDFPTQQHFLPVWTSSLQDLGQDKKRKKLKAEKTTELLLLPPSSTLSSIMVILAAGIFADATEDRCRGDSLSQMWYATNL